MANEGLIRLAVFLALFVLLAAAERAFPRRAKNGDTKRRWFTNWSVAILDSITLRLVAIALPLLAVGAALDASARGWGLFNTFTLNPVLEVILVILILDWLIWAQHLITHKIPLLWRLHRVHHSDVAIDVTTAIRFHPVEIALSMLLKIGAVYALGASALGVLLFEILLNGMAMFNHSNLNLPPRWDAVLRKVVVTPDMHRVHHSTDRSEHDSNYGFSLSIWDRLFSTYRAQPNDGHEEMEIGLKWQDDAPTRLGWTLALPFRNR